MKEIYKIYSANFLMGAAYSVAAIETIYRLSHGLNQAQIALLSSVFFICYALLEIPTGGFADTFGYKKSVFLGLVMHALAPLLVGLYPTYPMFLTAAVLAGIGIALQSGAFSSLTHDMLLRQGKNEDYPRVQGKTSAYLLLGTLFASTIVSIIYKDFPQLPYLLSSLFLFFAALLIYLIRWEFNGDKPSVLIYVQKIKSGVLLSFTNTRVFGLIILGSTLFFVGSLYANNIHQPLQMLFGVPVAFFGIIAAIFSGCKALVSAYSYKILQKIGSNASLLLSIFITAFTFFILSRINSIAGVAIMLLLFLVATFKDQVLLILLQKEISNEERSTMLSTYSFLTFIIVGITMPMGGYGIDMFGIKNILIILSIFTLVIGVVGWLLYKSNQLINKKTHRVHI